MTMETEIIIRLLLSIRLISLIIWLYLKLHQMAL